MAVTDPDVLIVGGGSAGAVLAARLSEDPARSVLLIDAGLDSLAHPPAAVVDGATLPGADVDWVRRYPAEFGRGIRGSLVRGALLGGGSAVNGGYFVRGAASDFDGWFGPEDTTWSSRAVLSSFVRSERDLDFGASDLHGDAGPVPVRRTPPVDADAVTSAFYDACAALGHPAEPDKNAWGAPGYGPVPRNVVDGIRVSTVSAYLAPAVGRPNLVIRPRTRALRVVVVSGRAVGVDVVGPDGSERLRAGRVVLCAGAVASAQLLLLSGIGPADQLRDVGIDVVVDSPGVGTRCSDHPAVELSFVPSTTDDPGGAIVDGALHGELVNDGGSSPYEVLAVRRSYGLATGDAPDDRTLHLRLSLMRPRSRGVLRLRDADPSAAPLIDLGHLGHPDDRTDLRSLVRLGIALLDSRALSLVVAERLDVPGADASDAEIDRWVDTHLGTSMHLSGTAPMGSDDDAGAVTDARCLVRGVEGLSVVDTSVLPSVTSRGPAATGVMLGEHAVRFFD